MPVNKVCRDLTSDVGTLPTWANMTAMDLMPEEYLVASSEDIRCFFYIFKLPSSWHRYMAFNRPLPASLAGAKPGKWYPCAAVLPMGFKNSVALAQHVHRTLVGRAARDIGLGAEHETRKDKPFPRANPLVRIYFDNFDELFRVS